jgi:hypothetical protein
MEIEAMEKNDKTAEVNVEGGFRSNAEKLVASRNYTCFERNPDPWEKKMEAFPKYVRRQNLTRFLAQYEIFKRILTVKGSVVECGVFRGGGLMTWAKLSAILEPVNLTRRIYAFDTFEGFPSVSEKDALGLGKNAKTGDLYANSYEELTELIKIFDSDRFLGHVDKVHLIKGDATKTIPEFIQANQHLVVSLLFLDFDLFEPTSAAIEHFYHRIPRGGVIAFDELDNPLWPGETLAMLEKIGAGNLRLQRMDFDPYIGFAIKE